MCIRDSFTGDAASYVVTEWGEGVEETVLTRPFGKYPYRPDDPADYHAATALETLFGYVYLKGELDRLRLFFSVICGEKDVSPC